MREENGGCRCSGDGDVHAQACISSRAAQLFGPGLISEALPEMLPAILRELADVSKKWQEKGTQAGGDGAW